MGSSIDTSNSCRLYLKDIREVDIRDYFHLHAVSDAALGLKFRTLPSPDPALEEGGGGDVKRSHCRHHDLKYAVCRWWTFFMISIACRIFGERLSKSNQMWLLPACQMSLAVAANAIVKKLWPRSKVGEGIEWRLY